MLGDTLTLTGSVDGDDVALPYSKTTMSSRGSPVVVGSGVSRRHFIVGCQHHRRPWAVSIRMIFYAATTAEWTAPVSGSVVTINGASPRVDDEISSNRKTCSSKRDDLTIQARYRQAAKCTRWIGFGGHVRSGMQSSVSAGDKIPH